MRHGEQDEPPPAAEQDAPPFWYEGAGWRDGPALAGVWTTVHAVDVDGDTIGHGWRNVEAVALDVGLLCRVPSDEGDPGLRTFVPWHRIAWVRWSAL